MEKIGEFEEMALKLAALNLVFEAARPGNSGREFLKMSEEIEEAVVIGVKAGSIRFSLTR